MTHPPKDLPKAPKASERILTTANELFYREGTRAVGVDEIVSRAGATKPTLYRAFPSKDHLIAAYLEAQGDGFWAYFEEAVQGHPDDPKAQILAFFDALGERATRPGYRGCALTNAAVEYPAADHPGRLVSVEHKQGLRERLREMTKAMDARKPKKLADSLLLLIEGVYVSSQLFGKDGPAAAARGAAEALIEAHTKEGHAKEA
ncbi:MAG: TetR/AcrR family transcriptional regulator [Phenylobacterium sp.]|uniref:TetR/AcrR family transcriptional regulator n=1 Tax=Phenylobacterium sp. TaxID=1871053 RepID=UPI0012243AA3|nr:TetR/AcrR family transcriptional regulator [Phenylobacterium sp.]TAJ69409.1 MAG: TetR/AcrR family transcriptional regulator [Phenylobacterium sp.]